MSSEVAHVANGFPENTESDAAALLRLCLKLLCVCLAKFQTRAFQVQKQRQKQISLKVATRLAAKQN